MGGVSSAGDVENLSLLPAPFARGNDLAVLQHHARDEFASPSQWGRGEHLGTRGPLDRNRVR